MGKNPLRQMVKTLVEGALGIKIEERTFTNKTPSWIGIIWMEEGMAPVEKGMRITRHMNMKPYTKYNACLPNSEQRAC